MAGRRVEARPEPGADGADDALMKTVQYVLQTEANAIHEVAANASIAWGKAVDLICRSTGPLVVSGIGKSGHIARKIASTFCSLGKPAIFVHASEASHGDLGLVQRGSVAIILSNSGETTELSDLITYCRLNSVPIVALTGRADSTLAEASSAAIVYGPVTESCVNGLAPTTSTTVSLAIGDALAVAASEVFGATPEGFRKYHPGGRLGARLLSVKNLMKHGDSIPTVGRATPMSEVVVTISEKALGAAVVVENGRPVGIITDGDMRRHIATLWQSRAEDIMTRSPVSVEPDMLASNAAQLMSAQGISVCLVCEKNGLLLGLLHIHDCLRAGAA